MLIKITFLCFIALACFGCNSVYKANNIVNEITTYFSKAVEEKDGKKFKSLFLNENVTWLAVISDHDINSVYKSDKNHKKVNTHDIVPFTEWLEKTKESQKVIFSNCKTSGDNEVMVADCEYEFYLNHAKTNYGRECFILVKTESGWKIAGMAFSSTLAENDED